jgi:hypothetical protein
MIGLQSKFGFQFTAAVAGKAQGREEGLMFRAHCLPGLSRLS